MRSDILPPVSPAVEFLDRDRERAIGDAAHHVRPFDLAQPGPLLKFAVDLSPLKTSGVLHVGAPADQTEQARFVHDAAQFRSDGEAMGIAITAQRGCLVATDDRKAVRVALQAGLTVVSCPELVKCWAVAIGPDQATLQKVVQDIPRLALFKPNPAMPEYQWWVDELAKSIP